MTSFGSGEKGDDIGLIVRGLRPRHISSSLEFLGIPCPNAIAFSTEGCAGEMRLLAVGP